jgi:hypothetical protein
VSFRKLGRLQHAYVFRPDSRGKATESRPESDVYFNTPRRALAEGITTCGTFLCRVKFSASRRLDHNRSRWVNLHQQVTPPVSDNFATMPRRGYTKLRQKLCLIVGPSWRELAIFLMKMSFLHRSTLLALVLTLTSLGSGDVRAADSTNAAPNAKPPVSILDNDEMQQLKKAREKVLAANPDLKTEEEKLKALHDSAQSQNPPPTAAQRNAMFAEWKTYQKKVRAAMLKVDPTLAPIFAKLDSARKTGASAPPFQPASAK